MFATVSQAPLAAPAKGLSPARAPQEEIEERPVMPARPSSLLALAPPPTVAEAPESEHAEMSIPGFKPRPHLVTPDQAPMGAVAPEVSPAPPPEDCKKLNNWARIALMGAAGVAVVGGVVGYSIGRASAGPAGAAQQSVSAPTLLDAEGNPAPSPSAGDPGLIDAQGNIAHERPSGAVPGGAAVAGTAAATVVTTRRAENPEADPTDVNAPVVIDFDDSGAAPARPAARRGDRRQGEWRTYNGTFHGETFSFRYPAGWRVSRQYNGFLVTHPQNEKLGAAFYWLNGAGEMSPEGMLQMLANDSGAQDWRTVSSVRDPVGQSPIGPVHGVTTEATYTLRGTPSHGRFHSSITVNRGPYASLWYASVSSTSAPASEWAEHAGTLQQIVDSFNADLNQGGPGPG